MSAEAGSARPARRWVPRAIFGLFVIVLLAIVTFGILDGPTRISAYRILDARTLLVEVTSGPGSVRVTEVSETPATVTVTVRALIIQLGPATAGGTRYELVVKLHDPLGNSTVLDGWDGERVELASGPPP